MKDFGTAVILAGGKSSRMGFDKQLLKHHDKRLLERVCDELREEFDDILVVTNRWDLYADADVRLCSDEFIGMGPLAGLHTALKHSRSRYVYTIACDMPVLCMSYVRHMKDLIRRTRPQLCVTRRNGRLEPFNSFYSTDLVDSLEERLSAGSSSFYYFICDSDALVIPEREASTYDSRLSMFTNINTGSEYSEYLSRIV